MSGGASAVDNNIGSLVGQERRGLVSSSVRREIDCAGQVRVIIGNLWQRLNELKLVPTLDPIVQFVSRNCSHHSCSNSLHCRMTRKTRPVRRA